MKKQIFTISLVATIFLGCGVATTDEETNTTKNQTEETTNTPTTKSGKVIDGYLYNAKVCYKDTSTCVYTNENGEYNISYKDAPLVVKGNSINTKTTADYESTLIANSKYDVITPLTTFVYNSNIDTISRIFEIDDLNSYINKDLTNSSSTKAKEIYNKGVIIERIVDSMLDNQSDLDKKLSLIKSIIDYCSNITFSELTQDDFKNIYKNFKTKEGESIDDTKATKLAIIVFQMNSLFGKSDLDIENRLDMINVDDLLTLDDESLATQMVSFVSSDKATRVFLNTLTLPNVKMRSYKYFRPNNSDSKISLIKGEDFNLTNADKYSVKLENNDFLTLDERYDKNSDIKLNLDTHKMKKDIEYVKLTIIPKKDGKIGNTKDVLLLVKKPSASINVDEDTTDLNITNTKTLSYSDLVFASSENENVDLSYSDTYLEIKPLIAGEAKVTAIEVDDYNVHIHTINVNSKAQNINVEDVVEYLYLVPPIFDGRYKLTNFDISMNDDDVKISGDLNLTTDTNISLSNFILNYDKDYGLYGGSDEENDVKYGFIFGNISYNDTTGIVMSFAKQNEKPYYWALATKAQICNAYENNQTMIDLINETNQNQIDCE